MNIEDLNLSVRAYNCLKRAGIDTVEQLRQMDDEQLSRVRNMSARCVQEIREKVEYRQTMTNADRIRAMSDEELASTMYGLVDLDERIRFCQNKAECDALLEKDEEIPEQNCVGCLVAWLQQPAEGVDHE